MRRRCAPAVALACAAVLAAPVPALAIDVTRERAQQLAADAQADPAKLPALEAVTSIDGQSADPASTLEGARGPELEQRLAALERSLAAQGSGDADAAAARGQAQEIIDGFGDPAEATHAETSADEGGGGGISVDLASLWLPLLIVVVIAAALLALRLARHREQRGRLAAEAGLEHPVEPLSELELRAQEAELAGRWELALRLRYGIALRALQEAGTVPAVPSITPARVSRELDHPRAGALVQTFERVVYGGRDAVQADAHEARDGWPAVVGEATKPTASTAGEDQR